MKLGQLLLHRGLIDRQQLQAALLRQRQSRKPLGQILLDMGIVSRTDILAALRRQPQGSVAGKLLENIPAEIRRLLPTALGQRFTAVPVARSDDVLVVAMADPTDGTAVEAIEEHSGMEVVAVISGADDILTALESDEDRDEESRAS